MSWSLSFPRPRRARLAGVTALALAIPLCCAIGAEAAKAEAARAEAAEPVTLNVLTTNDFHGRIDPNTVNWAGTIEQLRAAAPNEPSLLIGAGDLIGASAFASSAQNDQPTIDVMNQIGLDTSAVGNHEFDQGWPDLRDRVIGPTGNRNARWQYTGANVYAKGTSNPVLPEYAQFDLGGTSVAVIGAVTEETSTLVSPAGIKDVSFGNAVAAVNRVAQQLSDGRADNGEAKVIIATFHAGAQLGAGSNYQAEVAKGGEFAQMATLDPHISAIVNGHTHQTYAWDAPIPGTDRTRPLIQTGNYGDNLGQLKLTIDPETGTVASYTARNVPRTTTPAAELLASYPRLTPIKSSVDAALAKAAEIGNRPVGRIERDATRAFSNGAFADGVWQVPAAGTEDRLAESSLGDLVANALRDGIPADLGEADLGIVNPGGLRADLTYAGDTTGNPANGDGVLTYAEANAVLPFVNNIWLIELTGAQLKSVLEEQWQTNPTVPPSRPFLALGLSDNVNVVLDPSAAQGQHVTSVLIDGQPLDLTKTYTVSTFSFLGTGGDNFRSFEPGVERDTGLVDRDLWINYLTAHQPADVDFARQQVFATGLPTTVKAGDKVTVDLVADAYGHTLDLTSRGAPRNTTVDVAVRSGSAVTPLGSAPVTDGTAKIDVTIPSTATAAGTLELTAQPSRTLVRVPLTASTVPGPANILAAGSTLAPGQQLVTHNGYRLVMQPDGNLVEYAPDSRVVWQSGTAGRTGARLEMQADGNLVLYRGSVVLWSSGTQRNPGARLELQTDGNIVVYRGATPLWSSGVDRAPIPAPSSSTLASGQYLPAGNLLRSLNGKYTLVMQRDGNLVEYNGTRVVWNTRTAGAANAQNAKLMMQRDGNAVLVTDRPLWWTNTARNPGARLQLQDDGNVVVYSGSRALWSSGVDRLR